jgi:tight adherence protein B
VRLLAALSSGVAVAAAVALATGLGPRRRTPRRGRTRLAREHEVLVQAGVRATPAQFWGTCALIGVIVLLAVTAVTRTPIVALVPAVSVAALPRLVLGRRRTQRVRAVQEHWPEALRTIAGGIAAGMSLPQALTLLATSGPEPLAQAFARFPLLVRLVGVVPAIEVIKAELADPTSDRILEVVILAHERGGRLVSDVLRDLAEAATEDVRTHEEIATAALEQQINGRAVFVLPWLVLLALTARPGPFRAFYQSPGGLVVVAVAALASLGGMWIVARLSRDPVEPRVFGGPS